MFPGCNIPPDIAVQDGGGSREAEEADHSDPEERVLEEGDCLEQREKDVGDFILQPADASVEQAADGSRGAEESDHLPGQVQNENTRIAGEGSVAEDDADLPAATGEAEGIPHLH